MQATIAVIVLDRYDLRRGGHFGVHRHDDAHQLAWASEGVLDAELGADRWVLPSVWGMWIPAGVDHDVVASRPARLYCVYFMAGECPITWTAPTVVAIPPLLRELLHHLADAGVDGPLRRHLEAVVVDLVQPTGTSVGVVVPRDERARRVADALLDDPSDDRGLADWGRVVGASSRTLVRLFVDETGMPFSEWRTQVRLQASLAHLAAGRPVGVVATTVGYATASSFIAAFRRHFGHTPAAHFT